MTIPELLKWLRTTDGWFVTEIGCIRREHPEHTFRQCPGSAAAECGLWDFTRLEQFFPLGDARDIAAAADCWKQHWMGDGHDRNLRRRLARACRVRLSERQA